MIAMHAPHVGYGVEIGSRAFRDAMGQFATGVTVITTEGPGGPHGMTANAVTSVSLDPPLLLVCVSHSARLARYLTIERRFAVNILGADQEAVSRYFSGGWRESRHALDIRFDYVDGTPTLGCSIATLICDVSDRYEGGDHDIVLGRVRGLRAGDTDRAPLLFFRGRYESLAGIQAQRCPNGRGSDRPG
jgi:flavin reductase (DIM6/NTAB) family NADH-FMN oxidoreductase RutF